LPNVNKKKAPKIRGERKVQEGRTQVQAKKKKPPTRVDRKGNVKESSTQIAYLALVYQTWERAG
jgi:hypothetical protein